MGFRVEITDPALADAAEYVNHVLEVRGQPDASERWFRGLVSAIYSLEEYPERCPLIPERDDFPMPIRHLVYHSHRIIFTVDSAANRVSVLRVYHGSRSSVTPLDLS